MQLAYGFNAKPGGLERSYSCAMHVPELIRGSSTYRAAKHYLGTLQHAEHHPFIT